MALLEVRDLHVAYGKIEAVKGINFSVEQGQVVTLIGTNGAGKTTTLRTISASAAAHGGSDHLRWQGDPHALPQHQIVQFGHGRTRPRGGTSSRA